MPKKVINSLNSGELSPYLYARSDLDKYQSGCLTMENYMPLPYGGATRRPAIEYIGDSKQDDKVRLVPFSVSADVSYVLEFGDQYVRFFKDGTQVQVAYEAWDSDTELEQTYGWLRTESGNYYRCVENHFAGEFDEALEAGNWGTIDDWDNSTSYVLNDIVINDNAIYKCNTAHSGQEPPDGSYWDVVTETTFAVDTLYAQYDVVEYKEDFYQCLVGYTSAGFSEDLASDYWELTSATDLAYEIPTPYAVADLLSIKYIESIDVMFLVNENYPIQRLSRFSDTEWTFEKEVFSYPPLMEENDTEITMEPSARIGDITVESSEDYFDPDMVGGSMEIRYDRSRDALADTGSIAQSGDLSDEFDVSGITWSATIDGRGDRRGGYIERQISGGSWDLVFEWNGDSIKTYKQDPAEGVDTLIRFGSNKIKGTVWELYYGNTISINEDLNDGQGSNPSNISSVLNVSFVNWELSTYGNSWRGLVEVERSENGIDGWEKYLTIGDNTTYKGATGTNKNFTFSTDEPEPENTWVRVVYTKEADEVGIDLFTTDPLFKGIVEITEYISATEVNATVTSTLGGTGATTDWSEGAFSDYRGHPRAIALFENRLCYAGTEAEPNTIWMSVIDDYPTFRIGDIDTDGLKLTLNSGKRDGIQWMVPQERMIIGTAGSEWSLGASDERKAITPTGFDLKRKTTYGTSEVQGILVNSAVLFLMRQGRKVREWTPSYNLQDYVAPDLSILAEHITEGGVVQWDYQQQPDNILWSIRADGTLLGFTYERDQNVTGWHRHINAEFDFESIAVVPRADEEDEVWVSVKMGTERLIGRLDDREWGTDYTTEWAGSDLYVDYQASGDASHLEGKTVDLVVDGVPQGTQVVSGGDVTGATGTRNIVGLPYTPKLSPVYVDATNQYGTSQGGKKGLRRAVVRFKDTFSAKTGRNEASVEDVEFDRQDDTDPLYSGDYKVEFDSSSEYLLTTFITQDDPMPCTVLAIVLDVEVK